MPTTKPPRKPSAAPPKDETPPPAAPRQRSPRLIVAHDPAPHTDAPPPIDPEFEPVQTMDNQPVMVATREFHFVRRKINCTVRRTAREPIPPDEFVAMGRETIRHFIYACRMLEKGHRTVLDPEYNHRYKTYGPTPFGDSRILCFGPVEVTLPDEVVVVMQINKVNENTTAQDILDTVWLAVDITSVQTSTPAAPPRPATMKPKPSADEETKDHTYDHEPYDDNGPVDAEDW